MAINRKRAKQATEQLNEHQLGKELFNLLLLLSEGSNDEDEGLVNKISSIITTKKHLLEILNNPKLYDSEIIKTERIKDFFACLAYIKKENIYEQNKGIVLYELEFDDNKFVKHLLKEINLSFGFLGEILSWIGSTHSKYSMIYFLKNDTTNEIGIRVTKQKSGKLMSECKDRSFQGTNIIHSLCELSGKNIFTLLGVDEDKVRQ